MKAKLEHNRGLAEAYQAARQEDEPDFELDMSTVSFDIKPEWITRSVVKRVVMCTGYGAARPSKLEYVTEELNSLFKKMFGEGGRKPTHAECNMVTDAAIEGQKLAFKRQDEINQWFKSVAKAVVSGNPETGRKAGSYVSWETITKSTVVQEFRDDVTVPVKTFGMGGAKYDMRLRKGGQVEGGHEVDVSVGRLGDVKESKSQTALAANWTHSQDASILQRAWKEMPKEHIFIVHDCAYAPAGHVDKMIGALKDAFILVTGSDALDRFAGENGVGDEIENLEKGKVNLFTCRKSDKMFS